MKKKTIAAACVIAVIVIAVIIAAVLKNNGGGNSGGESQNGANAGGSHDDVEYAEGISGFYSDYDSETQSEIYGLTLPYKDDENNFEILNIGRYTGPFVEDGSDEAITDGLALLVKNTGDTMFEFLELLFVDEDGTEYTFYISTLPAGGECLVIEYAKAVYEDNVNLSFREVLPVYMDDPGLMSDEVTFSVEYDDASGAADITVNNFSERDIDKLYMCYKTIEDGIYIGGITYRTTFEGLAAESSLTNTVSHFHSDTTKVIFISCE